MKVKTFQNILDYLNEDDYFEDCDLLINGKQLHGMDIFVEDGKVNLCIKIIDNL